jgi:hypothetical protein
LLSDELRVHSRATIRVFATAAAVASGLTLAFTLGWVRARQPASEPELAGYMSDLQHHTHKLTLSIEAENAALAEFYLHELGEVAEQIEQLVPEHDGIPVSDLAARLLDPRLVALRGALARGRWDEAKSGLGELVAACNDCHAAAGHGFIRVEVRTANPSSQSFAK